MARTHRRRAWRKSKRWNPTKAEKGRRAYKNAMRWAGRRGRNKRRRSRKWLRVWSDSFEGTARAGRHRKTKAWRKARRAAKHNPYYTSPAKYARMSSKQRKRYRDAMRLARMRRFNPPISERELRVLKKIIGTHHRDNIRRHAVGHKKGARHRRR